MFQVLIVGQEDGRGGVLRDGLRGFGYGVTMAASCVAADRLARRANVAIVAVDDRSVKADEMSSLVERLGRSMPVMVIPGSRLVVAEVPALSHCSFDDVEIDFATYRARRGGRDLGLSAREFEILRYLVAHRTRVVGREELLRIVWGTSGATITRTVDVHIAKLRRKLADPPSESRVIATVHRAGYRFVA